jgi:hypothetical protein
MPEDIFRRFVTRNCGSHYCTPGHLRIPPGQPLFFSGKYRLQIIRFQDTAITAPEQDLGVVFSSPAIPGRIRGKPEGPAQSGCCVQETAQSAEGISSCFRREQGSGL